MPVAVYLSPSNQPLNVYACGATNEKEQMELLAIAIRDLLVSEYECTCRIATISLSINREGRPREAKESGSTVYLALHSNAGGQGKASGAMAFFAPRDAKSKLLAENIVRELDSICPYPSNRSRPVQDGMALFHGQGLAEIRNPSSLGLTAVLAETNFHDNPATAMWIKENIPAIARAYVRALALTFAISRRTQPGSTEADAVPRYYKVQVGAFRHRENAENLLNRLRQAGFDGFIRYE